MSEGTKEKAIRRAQLEWYKYLSSRGTRTTVALLTVVMLTYFLCGNDEPVLYKIDNTAPDCNEINFTVRKNVKKLC